VTGPSRIEAAPRRADGVDRAFAIGSAAALVLVRVTHPGHSASASTQSTSATRATSNEDDFDLQGGSITSSSGAQPQVQTSGS
jgi:hypothetical protein